MSHNKPLRRQRWLVALVALPVLAVALAWGYALWHGWRGEATLRDAIAEADRLDPGWRLADLYAKRASVPDEKNAALAVTTLTTPSLALPDLPDLAALAPNRRLPEKLRVEIDAVLATTAVRTMPDVVAALAEMPSGRFPFDETVSFIAAKIESHRAGTTLELLRLELLLRSGGRGHERAIPLWRAALNAVRSIGDEPMIISQLTRTRGRVEIVGLLERLLAQGEFTDANLAEIQRLLWDEESVPVLSIALRGERAGGFAMLDEARAAAAKKSTWTHWTHAASAIYDKRLTVAEALAMLPENLPAQQAAMLRLETKLVEVGKLPIEQWQTATDALAGQVAELPPLAKMVVPAVIKIVPGMRRGLEWLRVGFVAVAAERYRLKHGRWPDSAATLAADGPQSVPVNPADGRPYSFVRTLGGLVIGTPGSKAAAGFRLYDPAQRNRAAADAP